VPEILEVEYFRRAAERTVGRKVRAVSYVDPLVVEDGVAEMLADRRVVAVRRIGKVLTLDLGSRGSTIDVSIDLHFGMSGRIIVDGEAPIGELAYGASDDDRWLRFGLTFDRGWMAISDPRRFARVSSSRDGEGLGPDAFTVDRATFRRRLAGRRGPLKAVLLDQSVIAGLGNMLVDEILWRVGVDPRRSAAALEWSEVGRLHATMRRVLEQLDRRGGSHAGDLSVEHRRPGKCCPRDGVELARATVGGRTTFWCPRHQR
jgi:formamidopyrimidine-DNA glycosylase